MIVGCVNFYNNARTLPRVLRHFLQYVDRIVMVDGPYECFPHEHPQSTDGSYEIIREFQKAQDKPINLVLRGSAWPSQVEKRNRYLDLVDAGDLVWIIDGNKLPAMVTGGLDRIRESDATGWLGELVKVYRNGGIFTYRWGNPWILRVPEGGLHYRYNHYSIYDCEERHVYFPPYKVEPLYTYLKMFHLGYSKDYKERKKTWRRRVQERASGYEKFQCQECDWKGQVDEGEFAKCPVCGDNYLATQVVDE